MSLTDDACSSGVGTARVAAMFTPNSAGDVHVPYPWRVQACTCHSAIVPFGTPAFGVTLHVGVAAQPAAAGVYQESDGSPLPMRTDSR